MGCFLTMTDRDLAQLNRSLKAAIGVAGSAGSGLVQIQVSEVGLKSARQMAALIRREARSAEVSSAPVGKTAIPMKERFRYAASVLSPGTIGVVAQAAKQEYIREKIRAGKFEAEPIAAAILSQAGYLHKVERITKSTGVDIAGTNRSGQSVLVEVKLSDQKMDFGKRMSKGAYKDSDHPHGMRQMGDDWIHKTRPGSDPASSSLLGVHIDPVKEEVTLYRRIDSEAKNWKPLMTAPLSKFDLSSFA